MKMNINTFEKKLAMIGALDARIETLTRLVANAGDDMINFKKIFSQDIVVLTEFVAELRSPNFSTLPIDSTKPIC